MKGDFSRVTFDVANHFSRVLLQQGRVTLDADSNEQADILLHYLRTLARDLIGPYGGPAGADLGFQLSVTAASATTPARLTIGAGRYYVDGILCENASACAYDDQPDHAPPNGDTLLTDLGTASPSRKAYWLYLDVWERHITPIEHDRMREVALGGPDTSTRTKVVWQVKAQALEGDAAVDCAAPLGGLTTAGTGQMAAELVPSQPIKDPCVIAPDARYRGAENQLYRVEIHKAGSADVATVKWARDNGSIATAWLGTAGNDLLVASARGFSAGNWVELSDDTADLRGEPGTLVRLTSVDGNRLRVDASSSPPAWTSTLKNPKVRRWDQVENDDVTLRDGAIPLAENGKLDWIVLEDGVRVQFSAGSYRTGDYWLIPARVATGEIEWPRSPAANNGSTADFLPPRGIEHHYAPLGQLTWNGNAWSTTSCLCPLSTLSQRGPFGEVKRTPTPDSAGQQPAPLQPSLVPPPPQLGGSR
jgi:hypothetical protein